MVQKGASTKAQSEPSSVLGYPVMEQLLETEDFGAVNQSFAAAYDKLEKIMNDRSGGLKKQKEAEVAMHAYELTVELIRELLRVKQELAESQKKK